MVRENSVKHANAVDSTQLFNRFIQAQTCQQTFTTFLDLCKAIDLPYPPSPSPSLSLTDHISFYPRLKKKLSSSWKAQSLWAKLDKRFFGKEYFVNQKAQKLNAQRAAANMKVVVIGAGPCGLRTAIEMACLGVKTVVLEKRDSFSRNNVLHLWPYIITDLKALGAKKLYGRFCAGAIDHISIRQLQLILLKLSLILGVEVILNVSFEALVPPTELIDRNRNDIKGWTASVSPPNHPVSKFQFDVVVGADGKRNTLQGFKRKEFRGKLAIGLTVNFLNRNTTAEAKVEEISGVAYIFNQEFFKNLMNETGIDLENIVYYKGETHYFVMTAKKHSLVAKGVLKQDYDDKARLLSHKNVNMEAMMTYAREAADFSTHNQLPTLDFAINQYGQPDIALFDFTCMYASENAALFREVKGHKLLSCLVGDSLLEPFWPMGTGCARGFLAAFDTAWMTRQWATKQTDRSSPDISVELQVLAERESIYRLLHQTTPQNTMKKITAYTIDPSTRYVNCNTKSVLPGHAKKHYLADRETPNVLDNNNKKKIVKSVPIAEPEKRSHSRSTLTRNVSLVRSTKLQSWCQKTADGYKDVRITDMTSSWKSGLAICAIIHRFRPDLINWNELDPTDIEKTNQLAFDIAETQLGISPVMTGKEMSQCDQVDKLLMVTYISQFYEMFKHETPSGAPPLSPDNGNVGEEQEEVRKPRGVSLSSPIGLLTRIHMHIKRRSVQNKRDDQAKKKKQSILKKKEASTSPPSSLPRIQESVNSEKTSEPKSAQTQPATLNVGGTDVKLRPKKQLLDEGGTAKATVHLRASDRISALSNQLISQWEQNAPQPSPRPAKRNQQPGLLAESFAASDMCYFCKRRVYIVERLSAEGFFFHRHCFVCSHCGLTLRRGAYEFVEETGKFFCHASCIALDKTCKHLPALQEERNIVKVDGLAGTKETEKKSFHTPERIELENIRMSMLSQPEELPEEALTRHNFSINADPEEAPASDMDYMSDSSDDDIDWEAMLKNATNGGGGVHKRDLSSDHDEHDSLVSYSSLEGCNQPRDVTVTSWLDESRDDSRLTSGSFLNGSRPKAGVTEDSQASELSVDDISSHDSLSDLPEDNGMEEDDETLLSSSSSSSDVVEKNGLREDLQLLPKEEQPQGQQSQGKATETQRGSFSSASTDAEPEIAEDTKRTGTEEVVHRHPPKKSGQSNRGSTTFVNASYENVIISRKAPEKKLTALRNPTYGEFSKPPEENKRNQMRKYDTLDRVQDYLLKTPIDVNVSNSVDEKLKDGDDQSTSSSISLSSSTTSDNAEYQDIDALQENQPKAPVRRVAAKARKQVSKGILKTGAQSNPPTSGAPPLPRQSSIDSGLARESDSLRNSTSVWSSLEDAAPILPRQKDSQETNGTVASVNESFMSDYRPLEGMPADDDVQQSRPSVERRLSHDSLERRTKLRTRAKNRQLRQDLNRRSLSRSSSDRSSRSSRSSTDATHPRDDAPSSPSRGMVIIESSPSMETFVTPTAPPESRQQSMEINEDSFHTPLGDLLQEELDLSREVFTISPPVPAPRRLNLDVSEEFVSAPTTPGATQQATTNQSKPRKELPPLPKVPYLEAISPTGSANNTIDHKMEKSEEEINARELRVRERVEVIRAETLRKKQEAEATLVADGAGKTPRSRGAVDEKSMAHGTSPKPTRKQLFKTKRKMKKKSEPEVDDFSIKNALRMPFIGGMVTGTQQPSQHNVSVEHKEEHDKKHAGYKKHAKKSEVEKKPDSHTVTASGEHKGKKSKGFFGISPRKKHHKKGKSPVFTTSVDGVTTLDRKYNNESDREKAILRGERFRITPDPPTLHPDSYDSPDEEESRRYWQQKRRATLASLTPAQIDAKITRRVQIAARRQAKIEAQKRLRRAQVIQRQLEEVEVRQKDLEERGVVLEKLLRHDGEEKEDSTAMQEWFALVQEKNGLLRYENELMVYQRELQLEDVQSRLQQELRERMAMDDKRKSSAELAQEKEILQKMLEVVEQRDELVALLEEQRLKEREDTADPETSMLGKFNVFSDVEANSASGQSSTWLVE